MSIIRRTAIGSTSVAAAATISSEGGEANRHLVARDERMRLPQLVQRA